MDERLSGLRGQPPDHIKKTCVVSSRLVLNIVRDWRAEDVHLDVADFLIRAAVIVGVIDGRPMNFTKLAAYAGLPRTTVVRRVQRMVALGLLEYSNGKVVIPLSEFSVKRIEKLTAKFSRHIQKAAAELSKMDT